ncbi:hypothetical protein [Candidatus Arthromitus sp. SFB-rat-Yit]|uniref:hypothetical protein n=1 Tax=Candidatus Arthromitus sp. SFB-rat-Yit TaxID=1041504 RepID=UPI000227A546|nr:hypothetical protein [Candidatus Arthromitus sp. SFB-rat-Yit]BAK80986.1 N-acetylmannosamine-6-phosphate 2-epimerase [Candidatus Arthromitus sp. SFB-rat-Yit]
MILNKTNRNVIIDIDNYQNKYLDDMIFTKYVIEFSEKGGATAFLTNNFTNFKILKEITKLPIFFEVDRKFNGIINIDPEFLIIDIVNFNGVYEQLNIFLNDIREKFKGKIIGKIFNKKQAILACKLNLDGIAIDVFKENFDNEFISELCLDINIPVILRIKTLDINICKDLVKIGVSNFILGEDITNPNKILSKI